MSNKLPQTKFLTTNPSLVKIGQASKLLSVSIDTLRRWEKAGKITTHRTLGGTRLYSLNELRAVSNSYTPRAFTAPTKSPLTTVSSTIPNPFMDEIKVPLVETGTTSNQPSYIHTSLPLSPSSSNNASSELLAKLNTYQNNDQTVDSLIADEWKNTSSHSPLVPDSTDNRSPITNTVDSKIYANSSHKIYANFIIILITAILTLGLVASNLFQNSLSPFTKTANIALFPINIFSDKGLSLSSSPDQNLASKETNVLAASSIAQSNKYLEINVDTQITNNLAVEGEGIFAGNITAPNVIYSLVAGNNITISPGQNPTISANLTEADTLASVTARGATTAVASSFTGGLTTNQLTITDSLTLQNVLNLGQLTTDPTSATNGATYYNTGSNKFRCYINGSWNDCDTVGSSGGSFNSFDIAADTGTAETVSDGSTVNFTGSDGISTTVSPTNTITFDLNLDSGSGASSTVTSPSGLELTASGLSLIRGCDNGDVLKWNVSSEIWECQQDIGGLSSAVVTIKEGGTTVTSSADTLNFNGNDFTLTESPSGQVNINVDYGNSKILRSDQNETITGSLSFADGSLLDLSAVNSSSTTEGLKVPQNTSCAASTANGQVCWDNDTFALYVGNGTSATLVGGTGGGDITSVVAGSGLNGGGTSGDVTLNIGSSATINVNADDITVATDSIGDSQLTFNTGQNLTTSSAVTFATIDTGQGTNELFDMDQNVLTTSSVTFNDLTLATDLSVTNGGTGASSFTTNGVLYGNGSSAIQATSAGTSGQLLVANVSGVPTFVSLSGDATLAASGALTIAANAVALGTDTTGDYVATITGSSTIASSGATTGEGITHTLSVNANSIDASHLASTLTFGSTDYIDLSSVNHSTTGLQGLRLPNAGSATPSSPTSGEGQIAYDATNNNIIYYDGANWQTLTTTGTAGDITAVNAGDGLSGGGTSGSVTLSLAATAAGNGLTYTTGVLAIGSSGTITVNADDIAVTADSIGDSQLAFNTGQNLTTSSSVAFANITVATGGALRTNTGSGNTTLLQAYDVDGAAYTTFATLTAGNTPTFDLSSATTIGTNTIVSSANISTYATTAVTAGSGLTGGGTVGALTVDVGAGNGIAVAANAVAVDLLTSATDGATGTTSSASGLEFASGKLTMIQGCADNELLTWDETNDVWKCNSVAGVGAGGDITAVGDVSSGAAFTATAGNDGNQLFFEGSTVDGNEILLTAADPGSDLTVTIPSITGTLASLAGTQIFTGTKSFTSTAGISIGEDIGSGTTNNKGIINLISDGDNAFTTTIQTGIQTQNITYTLPVDDGSSNYVLSTNGSGALSWQSVTGVGAGTGDITAVGDVTSGDAFTATAGNDGNSLYFEGSTSDGNEIQLTAADPGSDLTVTIPAISGTLASLAGSQTFTGAKTFSAGLTVSAGQSLTLNSEAFTDLTGNGLTLSTGSLAVNLFTPAADAASATTSSASGLEFVSGQLSLLQGCSDGNALKWNETTDVWECGSVTATAVVTIQENDVDVSTTANTLDFLGNDFALTESPSGEVNIAIDYPNSHITRNNQNETISGNWSFTGSTLDVSATTLLGASPLVFEGLTADTFETTIAVTDPTADNTITLPNASGTVTVLGNTTTGSGSTLVLATSPSLTTPSLGAATATSINGLTISSTTGGTLTLANSSSLVTSGANSITLTSTGATNVTLPTTGTLATRAGAETLTNKTLTDNVNSFADDGDPTKLLQFDVANVGTGTTLTLAVPASAGTSDTICLQTLSNCAGTTYTFSNGLSETGGAVTLGGNLTQNTTITADNAEVFNLTNTGSGNSLEVFDQSTDTTPFIITNAGSVVVGGTTATSLFNVGSTAQFQVNASGAVAAATGITSSGTITFSGFTTDGGLIYTNGSGVLAQTATGSSGECLKSNAGGSPTWGTCGTGDITAVGDVASGDAFTNGGTGNSLFFNNNSNVGQLTATTLTGTRTYTLPDASGTVTVLGNTTTGSGSTLVLATSPSLTTPVLGAATATSINGLAITSTTGGTLTLANSSSLVTSGANSITLTSTGATNVTLPTTGTLATLAGTETLTNKTFTDNVNAFSDNGDPTKLLKLDVANVGAGTTLTLALPASPGTADTLCLETKGNCTGATYTFSNGLTEVAGAVTFGGTITSTRTLSSALTTTNVLDFTNDSLTTGTAMNFSIDGLTSGKGLNLSSTSTALTTGNLLSLDWTPGSSTTASGDLFALSIGANGSTSGNLFNILDSGVSIFSVSETGFTTSLPTSFTAASGDLSIANDIQFTNVTSSSIKSNAPLIVVSGDPGNSSNLTLQAYNEGSIVFNTANTTSTALDLTNTSITSGTGINASFSLLTTGIGASLSSTGTGLTTGSLLNVTSATTGAVTTNGIVSLNATGAYTSTSNVGLLNLTANSTAAGTVENIQANALTTGVGLRVGSTGTGLTTGSLFAVSSATTGAVATNGIVSLVASGNYTSTSNIGLLTVLANSTAAGTIERIEGNALTTGVGLSLASTGTGLTTGSLLAATSATTGAVATNGIVSLNASGNYTSTSNAALLNVTANSTAAGTIENIAGNALTTGVGLNIASTGTGLTTGSLLNVSSATTGAVATNGIVSLKATGNYTSTSNIGLLTVLANSTAAGTIERLEGNALTTGVGLSVASTGTGLTTGSLLNVSSATTGAVATNGIVSLNATGNYTSTSNAALLNVTANATTAGTVASFFSNALTTGTNTHHEANALTTGKLLDLTSSSANLTSGSLFNLSLTGNSAFTGNLAYLDWTPGSSTTATGDLFRLHIGPNGTAGNLLNVVDDTSSVFSVSETAVTSSLPVNFTSPGDVAIAYDLNFTNPIASFIKSSSALSVIAGETFNSADLTLGTYNNGTIVLSSAATTGTSVDLTNNSLTTGTGFNISSTSATSGSLLNVAQTTSSFTGNLAAISLGTGSGTALNVTNGGTGASFRVNSDGTFSDSTPFLVDDSGNVGINTASPLFDLDIRDTTTNFGSTAMAGAFISQNSYFGDEFTTKKGDIVADSGATFGDSGAWGMDEVGTCTWSNRSDVVNGITRVTGANSGCVMYTSGTGTSDLNTIFNATNLPTIVAKVKYAAGGANTGIYVGLGDNITGSTFTPANGIYFVNSATGGAPGTAVWTGQTSSSSSDTPVTCSGATTSASQFALLVIKVVSTSEVRFYIDPDVSDGVSLTYCGASTTNIPSADLGAAIRMGTDGTTGTLDTDFFRVWQDDSNPSSNIASNEQAPSAYNPTKNADLAENYMTEDGSQYESGSVVSISQIGNGFINQTTKSYDQKVLGIVSTSPDKIIGDGSQGTVPVALAGRVPVKVSTENGPIFRGDFLTSSSTPGVAMKATRAGQVLSKALEDFDSTTPGKVLAFVNVSYADPGNILANLSIDSDGTLIVPKLKVGSLTLDQSLADLNQSLGQVTETNGKLSYQMSEFGTNLSNLVDQIAQIKSQTDILGEKVASQEASINDLASRLSQLEQTTSASGSESSSSADIAQASPIPTTKAEDLNLTSPEILLATGSATLANLTVSDTVSTLKLDALETVVSDTFKSLGQTFLGNTNVAGDLTVDGTLSISNGNTINSLGTLYLQSSPLAENIDLFNGLVTVDKTGKIVAQEIDAKTIATNNLVISNEQDQATLGSANINAGQTEVAVFTGKVNQNSKIFLTPRGSTNGQALVVSGVVDQSGFVVSLDKALTSTLSFDWWIVEAK